MVLLYLKGALQLDEPANLVKTVFELSDTRNFSNILERSESDIHKYAVMFETDLNPSVKYYARSRCLLTTGWTHYSNLEILDVNLSGLSGYKNSIMPSRISNPIISTDSIQDNHDITNFRIFATGFDRVGLSTHNKTIYFITDKDNNIKWFNIADVDINEVMVDNTLLLEDEIYKINVIFGSSSNDYSQIASMTIVTGGNKNIKYLSSKDMIIGNNYKIKIESLPDIISTNIKISKIEEEIKLVEEVNISTYEHILSSDKITEGLYLVQIKSNLDMTYKNIILQTNITGNVLNGEENNITVGVGENIVIENPDLYDRIIVKPGGTVTIIINGKEYVFTDKTLIVTSTDMQLSEEEILANRYEDIFYVGVDKMLTVLSN